MPAGLLLGSMACGRGVTGARLVGVRMASGAEAAGAAGLAMAIKGLGSGLR